ncbi:cardiolipin synthase [Streptococcus sp. DD12]|uniref:cardiolipin synthase n=1 Tax=Streptococcus sp. DD12 TaxID=1777880 RepID=UPI000796A1DE|nr:cardiolipin synthase [Streptococcus sp. DD12]KXT76793.1 Cardiolipin synthetase [Streptococcus sp. DD12]
MPEEKVAYLLPKQTSKWAKLLRNRTLTISFFFILELAFLLMAYVMLRRHFPSLILWEHLLTFVVFIFLLNHPMDSRSKLSWFIIIAVFPIFGTGLLYFSLSDWGVRRLKKRLTQATEQTSRYLKQPEDSAVNALKKDPAVKGLMQFMAQSPGHFPIYSQTQVTYFPLGDALFPALLEDLKAAKRYIFMEYFIIAEGKMWGEILDILEKKAQAGLDVRILFDGMNEMTSLSYDYMARLHRVGIKAQTFSPIKPILSTYYNYRDHRKITVIDGQVAYTGGVNIADEYINQKARFGHWKDTGLRLEGSAVQTFKALFLTMWLVTGSGDFDAVQPFLAEKPKPCQAPGFVLPYGNSPLTYHKVAEDVYLDMMAKASDYLYLMTPYLILDDELQHSLIYAAKRGVDVRIMMPGIPDKPYAYAIAETYFKTLLTAGVKIYRYSPGFVHAKVYVSDDCKAVVGTINTDYRSLYQNFEDGVYLYQHPVVSEVKRDFLQTLEACQEVSLEDVTQVPLSHRLTRAVLALVGPLM